MWKVTINTLLRLTKPVLRPFLHPYAEHIRSEAEFSFRNAANLLPTSQIDEEDVIVASYPKSGVTWFQNLIAGVVYGINVQYASFEFILEVVPVLERPYYKRYQTPTFFKTHNRPRPAYRRVVYLVRDARDVMVSYYHFLQAQGENIDWVAVAEGNVRYGHWHEHVEAWLENPYAADMLIIHYEDLLREPVRELRRFCDFIQEERPDAFLQWAVDNASFEKMKARERRFGMPNEFPRDRSFMRRGIAGSYKDELEKSVLDRLMGHARNTLEELGYEVDGRE